MHRRTLALLALVLAPALAGCAADSAVDACGPDPRGADAPAPREGVTPFCAVTPDGWEIRGEVATLGVPGGPVAVLVHGLNEDRHALDALAEDAATWAGAVVTFDLRGHGLSAFRDGAPRGHRDLSAADYAGMDADVAAAADAGLRVTGERPVAVVGAGLGANLALRHAAARPERVAAVVLLSPGLDYAGVSAEAANAAYGGRVLYAASAEDRYAAESTDALHRKSGASEKRLELWSGKGHGSEMLDAEARGVVMEWLRG